MRELENERMKRKPCREREGKVRNKNRKTQDRGEVDFHTDYLNFPQKVFSLFFFFSTKFVFTRFEFLFRFFIFIYIYFSFYL